MPHTHKMVGPAHIYIIIIYICAGPTILCVGKNLLCLMQHEKNKPHKIFDELDRFKYLLHEKKGKQI